MRLPISVARGVVLFAWDCFALSMDLFGCAVAGHEWRWVNTSTGRRPRCVNCSRFYEL